MKEDGDKCLEFINPRITERDCYTRCTKLMAIKGLKVGRTLILLYGVILYFEHTRLSGASSFLS